MISETEGVFEFGWNLLTLFFVWSNMIKSIESITGVYQSFFPSSLKPLQHPIFLCQASRPLMVWL